MSDEYYCDNAFIYNATEFYPYVVESNLAPKGDTGETGPAGVGETGETGDTGASVLVGSGIPSDTLGNNDDVYVNIDNGDLYSKVAETWGTAIGNFSGPTTVALMTDVELDSIASGEVLKWNGTKWVNNTLAEAGISAVGHTHTASEVSDFDTEVSNNLSVVANTAKITNATHDGDVTGSDSLTIANDAVTYAKMQNVASNNVLLGNNAGVGGVVDELSATEVRTIINVEDGADVTDVNVTLSEEIIADNTVIRGNGGTRGVQDSGLTIDDTDNVSGANSLKLNLTSEASYSEGKMFYDTDNKCLTVFNDQTDSSLQVGRELWVRVKNTTGSTIVDGKVVYVNGESSGIPTIEVAQPDEFFKSRIIGVTTNDIITDGEVTYFGNVNNIDTSTLSTGTIYLADDGTLTSVQPTGSDFIIIIGVCLVVSATVGRIIVNPSASNRASETTDLNGFADHTDTTMSFVNATRIFTIAPVVDDFHYYVHGWSYKKSSAETLTIPNTEGLHVIYYDGDTLTSSVNPTDADVYNVVVNKCIVAYVYWDATNSEQNYFAEERHGISMSPVTHNYTHFTRGAQYGSGYGIGDIIYNGSGDNEIDAQFSISSGAFYDEDLYNTADSVSSTTGLPIYYLEGSAGYMRSVTQAGFSCYNTGSVSGTLFYNEWTGTEWQLTEVSDADFVLYHIFAINGYDGEPEIISVMGQNEYALASHARAAASTEISNIITKFPIQEIVPIATVIYQTDTAAYTNSVQARIRPDSDGAYTDWRTTELAQGNTATDHNNLANLDLAGDGITWGHIDDQVQSIYGEKTFNDTFSTTSSANIGTLLTVGESIGYNGCLYNGGNVLTSSTSITPDCDLGDMMTLTLSHNTTLNLPANIKTYSSWKMEITQDATGSRTLAFDSGYKTTGGVDPVITPTIGAITVLLFACFGSTSVVHVTSLLDSK